MSPKKDIPGQNSHTTQYIQLPSTARGRKEEAPVQSNSRGETQTRIFSHTFTSLFFSLKV